jgi:hypothetical protein
MKLCAIFVPELSEFFLRASENNIVHAAVVDHIPVQKSQKVVVTCSLDEAISFFLEEAAKILPHAEQ